MENSNTINHLQHPVALTVRSLLLRERRTSLKQMIIDDEENILQAIQAKVPIETIISTDEDKLSHKFLRCIPDNVPIINLAKRTAKKIFSTTKVSRTFAIANIPTPLSLTDLATIEGDIVVLDSLRISGNIGAIIRTAAALGAGAIALLNIDPVDTYDRRVIRASRGYIFKIPVINTNTLDFIQFCKNNAITLLVTTSYADLSIEEVASTLGKFAIVLGSEKTGCSEVLYNAADIKAKIKIRDDVESLNVSVAASIVLYLRSLHHPTSGSAV